MENAEEIGMASDHGDMIGNSRNCDRATNDLIEKLENELQLSLSLHHRRRWSESELERTPACQLGTLGCYCLTWHVDVSS